MECILQKYNFSFRCKGCPYKINSDGSIIEIDFIKSIESNMIKGGNVSAMQLAKIYYNIAQSAVNFDLFQRNSRVGIVNLLKLKINKHTVTNLYNPISNENEITKNIELVFRKLAPNTNAKLGIIIGNLNTVSYKFAKNIKDTYKLSHLLIWGAIPVNNFYMISVVPNVDDVTEIFADEAKYYNENFWVYLKPYDSITNIKKVFDGHLELFKLVYKNHTTRNIALYFKDKICWFPFGILPSQILKERAINMMRKIATMFFIANCNDIELFFYSLMNERLIYIRDQLTILHKIEQAINAYKNILQSTLVDQGASIETIIKSLSKILYPESFKYDEYVNAIQFVTRPVIIRNRNLGRFRVKIYLNTPDIRIYGYDNKSQEHPHPHIGTNGRLCMGGFRKQFNYAFAQKNYALLIHLIWHFLNSYNPGDAFTALHNINKYNVSFNSPLRGSE